MSELKTANTCVEIIVVVIIAMLLGNYLGYKVDRWKLAAFGSVSMLVTI